MRKMDMKIASLMTPHAKPLKKHLKLLLKGPLRLSLNLTQIFRNTWKMAAP